jgi:glycosyltransferase involved in cell wall biosynthesis
VRQVRIALTLYDSNFLGGGNKFTADLAEALLSEGHQVALCTANKPVKGRCHETLLNINNVYSSTPFKKTGKAKLYSSTLLVAYALKRCIKEFKPHLMINADSPPATFALTGGRSLTRIQYVHWPTELQSYKHSIPLELYRSLYWGLHYHALKKMDAVVCNSKFTQEITKIIWRNEVPSNKFHIIYPPVDVEKYLRSDIPKRRKLCYVGRLDPNKGIDMVIDAYQKIKQDVPSLELEIAGALNIGDVYTTAYYPKLMKRLEDLRDEKIKLKVNLKDEEIVEVYKSSMCFANFNPGEHFGICVIEAQAAGTVPVVARGGGQVETVKNGRTGFLVDDIDSMVKRLRQLFTDNNLYNRMSKNARKWSQNFSKNVFKSKWSRIIATTYNDKHLIQ